MKEITIDSSIWSLLKKNVGKHLDGNGNQKNEDLLIDPIGLVNNSKEELINIKLLELKVK